MFSMNSIVELEKCKQLVDDLRSSKHIKHNYMLLLCPHKRGSDENGVVDTPLDLEDIQKNLQRRKYFDKEDFAVDMRRMCKAYRENKRNPRKERELSREFEMIFEREFAEKFGCQRMTFDEIDDLARRIKKLSQWNYDSIINVLKNNEPQCYNLSPSEIKKVDLRYIRDSSLRILKSYVERMENEENMNANLQNNVKINGQDKANQLITMEERNALFARLEALPNHEKLNIIKLITDYEYTTVNLTNLRDSTVIKLREYVDSLQLNNQCLPAYIPNPSLWNGVQVPVKNSDGVGYRECMEKAYTPGGNEKPGGITQETVQNFIKGICKQKTKKKSSDRKPKASN